MSKSTTDNRATTISILVAYFLSGFSALVYQIIWMRKFGLLFGVNVFAVSTVLTAFMAGLALGNLYFGRLIDRYKKPLLLFALLETGIGLFGLIFPFLFHNLTRFSAFFFQHMNMAFYPSMIFRFVFAFFFLLFPTTLMGGTFPVLSKFLVKRLQTLGWHIGHLYSLNNLGAVFGCFAAGFIFIQAVGLNISLFIAAVINLLIAAAVFIFIRLFHHEKTISTSEELLTAPDKKTQYSRRTLTIVLWAFAIEGFTTLAYEVIWTRILLEFSYDKSVYFYSTVVLTFLFGLFLGSLIVARWIDRNKNLLAVFAWLEVAIGLTALVLLPVFASLTEMLINARPSYGESWWQYLGMEYFYYFLSMLVPATLMGMTFPVVGKICTENLKQLGRRIGKIGYLDTVGSIFGSFTAGFILIPLLGVVKAVIATALLNIVIGLFLLGFHPKYKFRFKISAIMLTVTFFFIVTAFVPREKYFKYWQTGKPGDRLLFYNEGAGATVAVPQHPDGIKVLAIDGAVTAFSDFGDTRVHKVLGYLPMLLHPGPHNALVIGLGMGVTAQSLIQPAIEYVDCVEICAGVVDASRVAFAPENKNVHEHPKLKIYVEDGRSYLLLTRKKYDIITSNAIHVRHSGNIYTSDFYQICRDHMTPNGIMCQWMSTNWLTEDEYKSLIKSFIDIFPYSSYWCVNPGHVLLIGSMQPITVSLSDLKEKFHQDKLQTDLSPVDLEDVYSFLAQYICRENKLKQYIEGIKAHSDNHPIAEFSRVVNKAQNPAVIEGLIRLKESPSMQIVRHESAEDGEILDRYSLAETAYLQAMQAYYFNRDVQQTTFFLNQAIKNVPNDYRFHEELASVYYNHQAYDYAIYEMQRALEIFPESAVEHEHLAMIYLDIGDMGNAKKHFLSAIQYAPDNPLPHYHLARIFVEEKQYGRAVEELERVIVAYPDYPGSYYYLAQIYIEQKKIAEAIRILQSCLDRCPEYREAAELLDLLYEK